jgi:hypothetical protein
VRDALALLYGREMEMDERALEHMLCEGRITAKDVLRETATDRVDGVVKILLRHLPYGEVRRALYERVCSAPIADVMNLTVAYYKHCEHAPSIASARKRDAHLDASPRAG